MPWRLYDFTSARGASVLQEWVDRERLTKTELAKLNSKLDLLAIAGPALPPKLLAGPVHKHIYKLIIHGDRMLRPMLCKGPFDMEAEYTLLLGAIEKDGDLDHDPNEAETNRTILLAHQSRRRVHDRYKR